MTPRAVSAHELVRVRDCEERGCEDDGTLREDLRVLCDRHAAAAARRTNGAVPVLELEDALEDELVDEPEAAPDPDEDALAERVCCWTGCEEPAAGVWGKGWICVGHRAELNRRVSAGKKRAHARARGLVDEPEDALEDVGGPEGKDVPKDDPRGVSEDPLGDVPEDAIAGACCTFQGCGAPAVSRWARGHLCAEHRAAINRRISKTKLAKSRSERRSPAGEQDVVEPLEPVAKRLVPAARRVDHSARAYRQACQRVSEAERELQAARDGWRAVLVQVDAPV